jgi:hypothetical protein
MVKRHPYRDLPRRQVIRKAGKERQVQRKKFERKVLWSLTFPRINLQAFRQVLKQLQRTLLLVLLHGTTGASCMHRLSVLSRRTIMSTPERTGVNRAKSLIVKST